MVTHDLFTIRALGHCDCWELIAGFARCNDDQVRPGGGLCDLLARSCRVRFNLDLNVIGEVRVGECVRECGWGVRTDEMHESYFIHWLKYIRT